MIALLIIGIMVAASCIIIYFIIKIPTILPESENRITEDESKILDLEFYIKEQQDIKNLFIRIRNLSEQPISNINGVFSKNTRSMNQSTETFKGPYLDAKKDIGIFLTSLNSLTRYYIDVKLNYEFSTKNLKTRIGSEFFLP